MARDRLVRTRPSGSGGCPGWTCLHRSGRGSRRERGAGPSRPTIAHARLRRGDGDGEGRPDRGALTSTRPRDRPAGKLDAAAPNTKIELLVVRNGRHECSLMTTKRDAPALTLFPALDREWVPLDAARLLRDLGPRRPAYLGWHRNRLNEGEPTDYFMFDHFENELRRPDALLRFWQTADRDALALRWRPPRCPAVPAAPLRWGSLRPSIAGAGSGTGRRGESPADRGDHAPARPHSIRWWSFGPIASASGPDRGGGRRSRPDPDVRVLVDGGRAEESRSRRPWPMSTARRAEPHPRSAQGQRDRRERPRQGADDGLRRDRGNHPGPHRCPTCRLRNWSSWPSAPTSSSAAIRPIRESLMRSKTSATGPRSSVPPSASPLPRMSWSSRSSGPRRPPADRSGIADPRRSPRT